MDIWQLIKDGDVDGVREWARCAENVDCRMGTHNDTVLMVTLIPFEWSEHCGKDVLKYKVERAEYDNSMKIIKILLKKGADPNSMNINGVSPIHYTALTNNQEALKWMIEKYDGRVNVRDNYGNTPLHYAAKANNVEVAELLASGVNIDCQNGNRETPLLISMKNKAYDMVQWLLENGADPYLRDNERNNVAEIAFHNNDMRGLITLFQHGVDFPSEYDSPKDMSSRIEEIIHSIFQLTHSINSWVDKSEVSIAGHTGLGLTKAWLKGKMNWYELKGTKEEKHDFIDSNGKKYLVKATQSTRIEFSNIPDNVVVVEIDKNTGALDIIYKGPGKIVYDLGEPMGTKNNQRVFLEDIKKLKDRGI